MNPADVESGIAQAEEINDGKNSAHLRTLIDTSPHCSKLRSQRCSQRQRVRVRRLVSACTEECSCLGDVLLCVPPSRWGEKEPRIRGACSGMRYYRRNSGVINNT